MTTVSKSSGRIRLALAALLALPACGLAAPNSEFPLEAEWASAVGDRLQSFAILESRYGPLVDCSTRPAADLDAASAHGQPSFRYFGGRMYAWVWERSTEGMCIYLQKPQRVGLTRARARLFLSALELPPDATRRVCTDDSESTEADYRRAHLDETGTAGGYRYSIQFAVLAKDLSPLDATQRQFAAKELGGLSLASTPEAAPSRTGEENGVYQLEFQVVRWRDLASISGNGIRNLIERSYAASLLDVRAAKLLRFNDLFSEPSHAQTVIVERSKAALAAVLSDQLVTGNSDAERVEQRRRMQQMISRALARSTDEWLLALDLSDSCLPALKITFEPHPVVEATMSLPELSFAWEGIADLLKPEFRPAAGRR